MSGAGGKSRLDGISKSDITQIKSMAAPPQLVKQELSATALLLGSTEQQAKVCDEMDSNFFFFVFFLFFFY